MVEFQVTTELPVSLLTVAACVLAWGLACHLATWWHYEKQERRKKPEWRWR